MRGVGERAGRERGNPDVFPDAKSIASNLPEVTCATVNPDTLDDPAELNGTDVG